MKRFRKFKYGICVGVKAISEGVWLHIPHFVGFEQKPTQETFDKLKKELQTDPELGFVDADWSQIIIFEASPELVNLFLSLPKDEQTSSRKKLIRDTSNNPRKRR